MRRLAALLVGGAVLAGACAQTPDVGRSEAIELLVLDGVSRIKAECIVDRVDGRISLAEVTGVDGSISDDDIAALATVTSSCRGESVVGTVGGVVGEVGVMMPIPVLEVDDPAPVINQRIDELVTGGVDILVAECVRNALHASSDPFDAVNDSTFISDALRVCDREI